MMGGLAIHLLILFGLVMVLVQYVVLCLAMMTPGTYLSFCERNYEPAGFVSYKDPKSLYGGVHRGWDARVCMSEEQLWCDSYSDHAPACQDVSCRSEEIRLSLQRESWPPDRKMVYTCPDAYRWEMFYNVLSEMNEAGGLASEFGVCWRENDKRAAYLLPCSSSNSSCRDLYEWNWVSRQYDILLRPWETCYTSKNGLVNCENAGYYGEGTSAQAVTTNRGEELAQLYCNNILLMYERCLTTPNKYECRKLGGALEYRGRAATPPPPNPPLLP